MFARGLESRKELICLPKLVGELKRMAFDTFPRSIAVTIAAGEDTWEIEGDQTQLYQVLLNLCVNARDAMPDGGEITVTTRNIHVDESQTAQHPGVRAGDFVLLEVSDTGGGIPPAIVARIFEPFFTTKDVGKGTGLGLSTSMAIVKNHGGFIAVESESGRGTTFRVHLPAEVPQSEMSGESEPNKVPRGSGELVLIIDDEASMRFFLCQTMEAHGYRAMTARDGAEGIAKYRKHAREIAAVITDMMMPVMDGATTIRELKRIGPEVKIIAASGFNARSAEISPIEGAQCLLAKPCTAKTLLIALSRVLRA